MKERRSYSQLILSDRVLKLKLPAVAESALAKPAANRSARALRDAPPKPAEPRPGLYRHYKDNPCRVIGLALRP